MQNTKENDITIKPGKLASYEVNGTFHGTIGDLCQEIEKQQESNNSTA